MLGALRMDDHEKCLAAARSTYEIGVRHRVAELQAIGMVFQGAVLIRRGQVAQGLALHDEGMVMAVGGIFRSSPPCRSSVRSSYLLRAG